MSEQMLMYVSIGVGIAVLVGGVAMVVAVWKMLAAVQQGGEKAAAQHASDRGWTFQTLSKGGSIDRSWTGTTGGIPWTATYRAINNRADRYRRHEFHWSASVTSGPEHPLLVIHEQSAMAKLDASRQVIPDLLSKLVDTATDKAIDLYFGRDAGAQVDMAQLQTVDGHGLASWQVMATEQADALVMIERTLKPVLTRHTFPAGAEAPVVLLLRGGVHLALRSPVSPDDVDRVVSLGSSLADAFSRGGTS